MAPTLFVDRTALHAVPLMRTTKQVVYGSEMDGPCFIWPTSALRRGISADPCR